MEGDVLLAVMFIVAMFCGVFVIFLAMRQRSEALERFHRERMAMIERGQIPLANPPAGAGRMHAASSRYLSIGIIIIGLGLGLMTLISIAAETPSVGVGLGGSIAILGAAFIVRSIVVRPAPESQNSPAAPPPPSIAD
jgi:hypothetical protein